jgi:hypothetical protein
LAKKKLPFGSRKGSSGHLDFKSPLDMELERPQPKEPQLTIQHMTTPLPEALHSLGRVPAHLPLARDTVSLKPRDAQGTPYEIKLLHTKGGKPSEVATQTPSQPTAKTETGDTYIYLPGGAQKPAKSADDFLANYMQQMLMPAPQVSSSFDPVSMLTQTFAQAPTTYS